MLNRAKEQVAAQVLAYNSYDATIADSRCHENTPPYLQRNPIVPFQVKPEIELTYSRTHVRMCTSTTHCIKGRHGNTHYCCQGCTAERSALKSSTVVSVEANLLPRFERGIISKLYRQSTSTRCPKMSRYSSFGFWLASISRVGREPLSPPKSHLPLLFT